MSLALSGQTAIVTGAATGIGEAIATRLASSGAAVVIVDLDLAGAERVAATIGGGAFAVRANVTRSAEVNQVVETVLARTGRIDILVNDAGIAPGKAAPSGSEHRRRLGPQYRHQSDRCFLLLPRRDPSHARTPIRPHREHRFHRRQGRQSADGGVLGQQGRRDRAPPNRSLRKMATDGICVNAVAPAVVRTRILDQVTPQSRSGT